MTRWGAHLATTVFLVAIAFLILAYSGRKSILAYRPSPLRLDKKFLDLNHLHFNDRR
jgi:hypothetical protein